MKAATRILLISGLVFAFGRLGHSQTVSWGDDSTSAFSFTLSGTGVEWGPEPPIVSPSGLWTIAGGGNAGFTRTNELQFSASGVGMYFEWASTSDVFPGWGDRLQITGFPAVIEEGDGLEHLAPPPYGGWTGYYVLRYDIPDPQDRSNWTWTMTASASGPAITIPEPNPLLLVSFGLLVLPMLRRR